MQLAQQFNLDLNMIGFYGFDMKQLGKIKASGLDMHTPLANKSDARGFLMLLECLVEECLIDPYKDTLMVREQALDEWIPYMEKGLITDKPKVFFQCYVNKSLEGLGNLQLRIGQFKLSGIDNEKYYYLEDGKKYESFSNEQIVLNTNNKEQMITFILANQHLLDGALEIEKF
ncbi:hypothetical protein ABD87_22720 [Lysinibacillus sphaericus]|uniref:hypothetical protein n=1 Tax=Lysinibacillus sphaericus TaxID=1421 RepID=UPI0018CE6D56|nr:hypothetical protein [Lysinibacillus sphaericus]MBG9732241.1 hypothetical protein [Lysinibacillus sphaericus]